MSRLHKLTRGHHRLRPLVEFALAEGWEVFRTSGGHLKFCKPGLPNIYSSATASDPRSERNARAQLRRAKRQAVNGERCHD
jgi:hypothetical protein